MSGSTIERRATPLRLARKFDTVQDVYEGHKNRVRRRVLPQLIPAGGVGAELGVHKGHLTPGLIEWLKPTHLYVVDPWYLLGPTWDWAAGDRSTVAGLRTVIKRLKPHLEAGTAEVVIADDREFLASLPDGRLDWVYVDSSHAYEHTVQELELLVTKVRPGGVIAGDDWQPDPTDRHHGVCRAVREFADAGRIELFHSDHRTRQWAARTPAVSPRERAPQTR